MTAAPLLALPEPAFRTSSHTDGFYTADQVRAAILADRERVPEREVVLLREAAVAAEWARQVNARKDVPKAIRDAAQGVSDSLNAALRKWLGEKE